MPEKPRASRVVQRHESTFSLELVLIDNADTPRIAGAPRETVGNERDDRDPAEMINTEHPAAACACGRSVDPTIAKVPPIYGESGIATLAFRRARRVNRVGVLSSGSSLHPWTSEVRELSMTSSCGNSDPR